MRIFFVLNIFILVTFCVVAQNEIVNYKDSTTTMYYKMVRGYNNRGQCIETFRYFRKDIQKKWSPIQKKEYKIIDSKNIEILYDWNNTWIPQKKMVSFSCDGEHVSEEYEMDSASGQWQGIRKSVHFDKPDSTRQAAPVFVWSKDENKWVEKKPTQTNEYLQQTEKYLALGWCRTAQWYYSEYKRLFNDENADIEAQLSQCQNAPNAEENEITTLYWAKDEKRRECKEKIEEYLQKDYCQLADWYYKELMQYSTQEDTLLKNRIRDCEEQYKSEELYLRVEKMPQYPKGNIYLWEYIKKKAAQYPQKDCVVVQFIVTTQGEIAAPRVVKSVSPEADRIALEIITSIPLKFIPGEQAGEKVPVLLSYPVPFSKTSENCYINSIFINDLEEK